MVHDVERNNYRVDIVILPKRFECKKCGLKITPPLRGIEEGIQATTRLLEFLKKECLLQPITKLAQRSGFSIDTIQNIMIKEIEKHDEHRKNHPLPAPRVLGIDEKHILDKSRGTLVDVDTGRLLNMLENNNAETMQNAIMQLAGWDTDIEVVTCDMSGSYLSWLKTFLPNATIVVDKFHVIQGMEHRISETKKQLYAFRKELVSKLTDPDEIVYQRELLSQIDHYPRLFNYSTKKLMDPDNADRAVVLQEIVDAFPEFQLLREIYRNLEELYESKTFDEAEEAWNKWMAKLPPAEKKDYQTWCDLYSLVPPLFDNFRSYHRENFQKFKEYILNYFKAGCDKTNASTEGVNTLIERINRESNGLKFESLRGKSLYASLVSDRMRYGINLKTVKSWTPTTNIMYGSDYDSGGSFTCVKQFVFTTETEAISIPHTNILSNNEELFALFSLSTSISMFDVDEISFLNYAVEEFDNYTNI